VRAILWEIQASQRGKRWLRIGKLGFQIGAGLVILFAAMGMANRLSCRWQKTSSEDDVRPRITTIHAAAFSHVTAETNAVDARTGYPIFEYQKELLGESPVVDLEPGEFCWVRWLDVDDVHPRGNGPAGAVRAFGWMNQTIKGRPILGRYVLDAWHDREPSTGAIGFPRAYAAAGNVRLIERVRPAKPGPPGSTVLMPGQCAIGSLERDSKGIIGRYSVELPAGRSVAVTVESNAHGACLWESLEFAGKEISCEGERDHCRVWGDCRYRIPRDGQYLLTLYRDAETDTAAEERRGEGYFCLAVAWGEVVFDSCDLPRRKSEP
jgi:hypothetical protein